MTEQELKKLLEQPKSLFIATAILFCLVIIGILLDLPVGWYFPLLALAAGLMFGELIVFLMIYKIKRGRIK